MDYKDYKRQVKLSKILDRSISDDFKEMHEFVLYVTSGLKKWTHGDYPDDVFYFKDDLYMFKFKYPYVKCSRKMVLDVLKNEFDILGKHDNPRPLISEIVSDKFPHGEFKENEVLSDEINYYVYMKYIKDKYNE